MYEKQTNAKSNFDFNQILSKIWLYIYIYFYMYVCILPRFIYFRLSVFYIELTHLAQKFKKKRLDETRGVKLNSN